MNQTLIIWALIIVAIILFIQYILTIKKLNKLKKENTEVYSRLHQLTNIHNRVLRQASNKVQSKTFLDFVYKDNLPIGNKVVTIKNTDSGSKFFVRGKKAGKLTDIEVFLK